MLVGVPREIKDNEYRVAMTPGGVRQLTDAGHQVYVETQAGEGSGFSDDDYESAGASIVPSGGDAWSAELVVKVKEPQPSEYGSLRSDLALFTYLHLAADEKLTKAVLKGGLTGIAYETVELANGSLPLLTPMSEVAGRLSIQVGAHCLERPGGGRGKLLGGIAGVRPADVVIIGGGIVGTAAAWAALGMGAQAFVIDINVDRLRYLNEVTGSGLTTLSSNPLNIAEAVRRADLLVGAVLIKGGRAPRLVTRGMIAEMAPGSVAVDVAVDQGGCFETTRPTTHSDPTYLVDGVIHYCVTNMPALVPRTSTYALSNATLPYIVKLAQQGIEPALVHDEALARGVNTYRAKLTCPGVAEAFALEYASLESLLSLQ